MVEETCILLKMHIYHKVVFYGHNLQFYPKWIVANVYTATVYLEIIFLPVSCRL